MECLVCTFAVRLGPRRLLEKNSRFISDANTYAAADVVRILAPVSCPITVAYEAKI